MFPARLRFKSLFIVFAYAAFCISTAMCACPLSDLSGDCIVDMDDLLLLSNDWMSTNLPAHSGLIARWTFDESSGETAADDIGGHNGSLHNDPQWMPLEGYKQGALFFDGIDDYVEIEGYPGITGPAGRTCTAWIQTTQTSGTIISWGQLDAGEKWLVRLNTDGTLRAEIHGGYIFGTTPLNDDQWHHIAVTLEDDGDPTISEARLYVDGKLETIEEYIDHPVNTAATANVQIGVFLAQLTYFNGKIDDVKIFNEALTEEDILRLYETGSALHHNPDFNTDDIVNIQDYAEVSQQWKSQEPVVIINEFLADNDPDDPPVPEEGQLLDGNGESSDWIEIYNQTDDPIDLADWALTDNEYDLLQWQFPENTIVPGHSYRVVFASGKKYADHPENYPYVDSLGYLHTNFRLSKDGGYLAIVKPDGTPEFAYDSVLNPDTGQYGYPQQDENISYGILQKDNQESYFARPTPGDGNRENFLGEVDTPDFSHDRGYYDSSFTLTLTTETEGAVIRYTLNGTEPTLSNGQTYSAPLTVTVPAPETVAKRSVRAAAFKPGYRDSRIRTKTYILNATSTMKSLPGLFLSGSETETFYNPNGIMAITPEYNNFLGHGMEYERPVSMEYFSPEQGFSFQEDCGIRVHGSVWMRPRYTLPSVYGIWTGTGKPSLRLYFRGSYGEKKLRHSILEQFPEVDDMDTVVLRAGHNDQTNPFIRDEMIRRLQYYMGYEASLGNFVNLHVNGFYKGYFNLCERVDEDFCQKYYDSDLEWDVVAWTHPDNLLDVNDGDGIAFTDFINYARNNDLSDPVHYNEVVRQLDLEGFIDYLILQLWGGNWDWPQNNWTATGERSPNRIWRFYVWDAEGAMDNDLYRDRFGALNGEITYLAVLYRALKANEDFRVAFSDRVQRYFFESDSVMQPEFLDSLFWQLAGEVEGVIPSINTYIPNTYIPNRNPIFVNQCIGQGLFTFEGPRIYLNGNETDEEDEGLENSLLSFQNAPGEYGDIYFTLDGSDPRLSLSEEAESNSIVLVPEDAPKRVLIPSGDIGTNWRWKTNYNDTGWNAGLPVNPSKTGGVGYERDNGNQDYISYDVEDEMYDQRTSAYIRIPFSVDAGELATWNTMTLSIRYDDGFVAYINGTEVCRRRFNGTPEWDSSASSDHENYSPEVIPLNDYMSALSPGDNILAVHGLNIGTGSSDFIISPILEVGYNNSLGNGISARAQLYTGPVSLDKSVRVKARTLNGSTWSGLRQDDILIGHVSEDLRISELMYHPGTDPNEEYVELTNTGSAPVNLNFAEFTNGIKYTFGDTVLDPGAFLLLVQNQSVFENRYGTGLPIAGEYEGALSDAGEKIKLRNVLGHKIQTVDYKDGWYNITDGEGFSLTAIDPDAEKTSAPLNTLAAAWNFNETSGTTVLDSLGLNNGTLLNMQNTDRVLGREDKALLFDGIDDYVDIAGYQGVTGPAGRTCTAWIQTTQASGTIISWGELELGEKWVVRLNTDGTLRAEIHGGYIFGTTPLNDDQWHHIAVALEDDGDPNISEARLYIDGEPETIGEYIDHPVNTAAANNVQIGVFLPQLTYFNGKIDDVRIYERALSDDEIAVLAGDMWDQKEFWRPSAALGGSPGYDDAGGALPPPGSVVINEVLAHSHDPDPQNPSPDWIELHNTTDDPINIGGWFLSDNNDNEPNITKYEIPLGTSIPANDYIVFYEDLSFNNPSAPGVNIPFALSEGGDKVCLQSGSGGIITGYQESESFGASASDVAFGRYVKSILDGGVNFVPMSENTPEEENAYPMVGPVVITEIMYNPDAGNTGNEYLELKNISGTAVTLQDLVSTETSPGVFTTEVVQWKFSDGIDFLFPANTTIPAGEYLIIAKDPAAFTAYYGAMPPGVDVLGPFQDGTSLSNGGERLQIVRPGDQEYGGGRYWIRTERVTYDDETPWPTSPDGTGHTLHQKTPDTAGANYGNDVINWQSGPPGPGQ